MSIVLPTRGDALELGKCLKRAAFFAREHHGDCEVVVVDDGNHPDVDTVVRNWRDRFARCVLVRHNKERGCGTAARTGVLMAHGKAILVVEPGRAAGMEDLGTLLADLENGADFVVASRRLPGSIVRRERGLLRRAAEASFLLWARLLVPVGVRDLFSGCYGLRRGAAMTVARRSQRAGSGYLLEWVALSQRSGMQVTECPGTFEFPEGFGRLRDLLQLLDVGEIWSIRRGLAGIRYSGPQPQQVLLQDTSFVKLDRAALLAGRDGRTRS